MGFAENFIAGAEAGRRHREGKEKIRLEQEQQAQALQALQSQIALHSAQQKAIELQNAAFPQEQALREAHQLHQEMFEALKTPGLELVEDPGEPATTAIPSAGLSASAFASAPSSAFATPTPDMTDEERAFAQAGRQAEAGAGTAPAAAPSSTPSTPSTPAGSRLLSIGGKTFRFVPFQEQQARRAAALESETKAKRAAEASTEDRTYDVPGVGPVHVPAGTPDRIAQEVFQGATSAAGARIHAGSAERVAQINAESRQSSSFRPKLEKLPDGSAVRTIPDPTAPEGVKVLARYPAGLPAFTKARIDLGRATLFVRSQALQLLQDPEVRNALGPVGGRITSIRQLAGNPNPKVQQLAGELSGFAALSQGIHGFRSHEGAASTVDKLFANKFTPEAIAGGLQGLSQVAEFWDREGNKRGYRDDDAVETTASLAHEINPEGEDAPDQSFLKGPGTASAATSAAAPKKKRFQILSVQ